MEVLEGRRSAVAPHGLTLRRRGEQPPAGAAPPVEPPRAAAGVPRAALGAGRRAAPGRAAHGRDGPGAPGRARGCGGAERPQAGRGCRCPGAGGAGAAGVGPGNATLGHLSATQTASQTRSLYVHLPHFSLVLGIKSVRLGFEG